MSVDENQLSSEQSKKAASAPAVTEKSNVAPINVYPYPRNIGEWQAKKSAVPLSFRPMALWKLTQPMRDMETQRWFYTEDGQDLLAGVGYRLILSEELAKRGKRLVTEEERTGSV